MGHLRSAARWFLTTTGQRVVMGGAALLHVWLLWVHWGTWVVVMPVLLLAFTVWAQWRIEGSRRYMARLRAQAHPDAPPTRPQGVVVRHANGYSTPVELVYEGRNGDGLHVWGGATTLRRSDVVEVAVLPPNSRIQLPVDGTKQ